jgi:hypothetical protein
VHPSCTAQRHPAPTPPPRIHPPAGHPLGLRAPHSAYAAIHRRVSNLYSPVVATMCIATTTPTPPGEGCRWPGHRLPRHGGLVCCKCMFQVFQMFQKYLAIVFILILQKYVASVSEACCKFLFKMFHLFLNVCYNRSDMDVLYVLHKCCNTIFQMFQLFSVLCCSMYNML